MTESQISHIRKAKEAVRELIELAAKIREEVDHLSINDRDVRAELLEAAEGFEGEAQKIKDALRAWREDIH